MGRGRSDRSAIIPLRASRPPSASLDAMRDRLRAHLEDAYGTSYSLVNALPLDGLSRYALIGRGPNTIEVTFSADPDLVLAPAARCLTSFRAVDSVLDLAAEEATLVAQVNAVVITPPARTPDPGDSAWRRQTFLRQIGRMHHVDVSAVTAQEDVPRYGLVWVQAGWNGRSSASRFTHDAGFGPLVQVLLRIPQEPQSMLVDLYALALAHGDGPAPLSVKVRYSARLGDLRLAYVAG